MKTQTRTALITLCLVIALAVAACAAQNVAPPPTPTSVPLMEGGPLPTRVAGILQEASTPIAAFTPAPPSLWTGLSNWSLVSVARAAALQATATPVQEPAATATDTPTPTEPVASAPDTIAPTQAPTTTPTAQPASSLLPIPQSALSIPHSGLPLLLLSTEPADGAAWRGEPVVFAFDSPLDPSSVDGLTVEPFVGGVAALDGFTLTYTLEEAPLPDTRYRFTLGPQIVSTDGRALAGEMAVDLVSPAPFLVTSTQPSDGSQEVAANTPLVVIFNQPVVPLSGIDDQAGLPNPLTIEPAVAGTGAWINTSIYRFQPEKGLAGSTAYKVTVSAIQSLAGDALAQDPTQFSFTTTAPVVISSAPSGVLDAAPDSAVTVQFSQPMDQPSSEAAFRLVSLDGDGSSTPGAFVWSPAGDNFTFTPDALLVFGERYAVILTTEALSFSGTGNLRQEWRDGFQVVGLPAIANSDPAHGREEVSPEAGITVRFTGNLSITTVLDNVTISPPITDTAVYSYFSPYSNELYLNWAMQPRSRYTVTLGAAIADIYGNTLGEDASTSFTTGDRPPLVQLNVPRFTHFSAYTDSRVSLLYRNMPSLEIALYGLPQSEVLRLLSQEQWQVWLNYQHPDPSAYLVWQRIIPTTAAVNELGQQILQLTDKRGDRLPTGVYLLQVA